MKQLRKDQTDRINELNLIFDSNPKDMRAFLQMPVGTGKTFTALNFAIKRLSGDEVKTLIWVCHQTGLSDQSATDFRDDFKLFGGKLSKDLTSGVLKNIQFKFTTWQGLRESINKKLQGKCDMLIMDEAHYGSSNASAFKNGDHVSFKKILNSKLFNSTLFISATPWDLNPEVFKNLLVKTDNGYVVRKDRLALLTLREAKELDQISDVTFNVFHSADTLKLKSLEDADGELLSAYDTVGLAEEVLGNKIDLNHEKSKLALRTAVAETTIEGFMRLEMKNGVIPPTIIFCRGIDGDPRSINSTIKIIKRKAKEIFGAKFKCDKSFVSFCHSQMVESNSTEVLNDFRSGKINILCVANMAQEGFNYPELEVAVDLAPSLTNIRRRMQRIGRIARKKASNVAARYYYSDTVTNYITKNGVKYVMSSESKDMLIKDIGKREKNAEQVSSVVSNAVMSLALNSQHDSNNLNCEIDLPYLGTKTVLTTNESVLKCTSVGFIISEASNFSALARIKSNNLFSVLEADGDWIPWSELSVDAIVKIANMGS